MRVLITGGCGFLGAYLARYVLARGDDVVVQDVRTDDSPFSWILTPAEQAAATVLGGDTVDPTYLFRVLREHRIDALVCLSRYASPTADQEPLSSVRVNVEGAVAAMEAVRLGLVDRLVWASSTQVFGRHTRYHADFGVDRIVDNGPHRPWDLYSATKSLGEYLVWHYFDRWGADVRGVRPIGTFGPGRRGGHVGHVTRMIFHAAVGAPYVCANGDQALPLVYVEDSSRGFEAALYHKGPELSGRTLTIGGYTTTHGEMAEIVRRVVPDARITVQPGDGGEPLTLPQDTTPFRTATGFELRYSLEDGVRKTVEFFRSANPAGQVVG